MAFTKYEEKPKEVGVNNWKLSGKVLAKVARYSESGNLIVTIKLLVPANNSKYDSTLMLKSFNSTKPDSDKNIADQINERVEEGKDYHFTGSFTSQNRKTKEGKDFISVDQVIWKFEPAFPKTDKGQA